MSKEDLIKKLIESRTKLNKSVSERKSLNEEIKECKQAEEKIIRELEDSVKLPR